MKIMEMPRFTLVLYCLVVSWFTTVISLTDSEDYRETSEKTMEFESENYLNDIWHLNDLDPDEFHTDITEAELKGALQRYTIHTHARLWIDAVTTCWSEGGHLATPGDATEAQLLGRLFQAAVTTANITGTEMRDAMHVGINNIGLGDSWVTVEGREVVYGTWMDDVQSLDHKRYDQRCAGILSDSRYIHQRCNEKLIFACDKTLPVRASQIDYSHVKVAEYKPVAGQGRYKLHASPLPWLRAEAACRAEGAALAVPASGRAAGLLAGALFGREDLPEEVRSAGVLVGANDLSEEGDWRNLLGRAVRMSDLWAPGKPNGQRAANCAAMVRTGHFEDVPCAEHRAYLCEKTLELDAQLQDLEDAYIRVAGVGRFGVRATRVSWLEAAVACHADGASLAAPRSPQEVAAIEEVLAGASSSRGSTDLRVTHAGVHDMDGNGRWNSLNGKIPNLTEWRYANNYHTGLMKCGGFYFDGSKIKFTSIHCERKYYFICQKPL